MRKRLALAVAGALTAAVLSAVVTTAYIEGGWPETCLEMNDMVEASPLGSGAVGIYQRAFGDGAEAACQSDHRADVRGAFMWAFPEAQVAPAPQPTPAPSSNVQGSVSGNSGGVFPISLDPGLYVFSATYNPNDNFIVDLVGQRSTLLFNQLWDDGHHEVTQRIAGGSFFLEVDAEGAWTISWYRAANL